MKRLLVILAVVGLTVAPWPAVALTLESQSEVPQTLILSELKVKNDSQGFNELIELFNNSEVDIDLSQYALHYYNNPEPPIVALPTKTLQLPSILLSIGEFFVLARDPTQIEGSVSLTSITSLVDTGGLLELIGPGDQANTTKIYDEIVWKDTNPPTGGFTVPPSNQSFQRSVDENGELVATDPIWIGAAPTPFEPTTPPIIDHPDEDVETPTPQATEPETPTEAEETPTQTEGSILPIRINELLPNPIAPQTDALDEFIELFNPNNEAIDLDGYTIQTGSNFTYRFVISDTTIEPNGYLVLTSGETNLALSNSTGNARLLDQSGGVISEITSYSDAPEGQAWAFENGKWDWTTSPTPTTVNNMTKPAPKAVKAAVVKSTAKAKKAKTAAKTTTKKATTPVTRATFEDPDSINEIAPVHPSVLVGVSTLALLYGAYEYRHDLANRLYQLRRYRETRRATRT